MMMQADSLKKGDPRSWTSENGNANIGGPQVNFQNEISDPDECAKAANVTLPDRSCMGDPTYELGRPQHNVVDRGSTWKQKVYELGKCMNDLSFFFS